MRCLAVLVGACCLGVSAAVNDQPVSLQTKVEPDWGSLTSGYLVDEVDVQLTVLSSGEPFSMAVKGGSVPDPVVRALAQWRFNGLKKSARDTGFLINLRVPVRRKLDPDLEQSQRPVWYPPAELLDAVEAGEELDAKKAAEIQSNLPVGESLGNFRTSLLVYYARTGASDPESARKSRRDLILWLIHAFPQDGILASHYAVINASGEPLADREGSALVKKEWLNAVTQYPKDNAVAEGAATFLRVADPSVALRIVAQRVGWSGRSSWLGNLYAFAGLGVNAVAPATGAALTVESPKLSGDGLAASFRRAMLESPDLKLALSGLATTAALAHDLAARNTLPEGYAEYCGALMKHARDLYPQTSLSCDLSSPETKVAPFAPHRVAGKLASATLIKRVQPRYPKEAKKRHVQGVVEFTALIGADGRVQKLELIRAPFLLYDESYSTALQWEYRPYLLNGSPVPIITDIVINYALE
jgi:hypothetical protein